MNSPIIVTPVPATDPLSDPAQGDPVLGEHHVLTGLWLRSGYTLTDTSQFRDDVWRLKPAVGIRGTFIEVRKLLHWLAERTPAHSDREQMPAWSSLTAPDVLDYPHYLMTLPVGVGSRENSRRADVPHRR